MKKLKKIYCGTSFAFGTVTLVLMLFLCFGQSAYATGSAADANQQLTDTSRRETGELTAPSTERAEPGTTNGMTFSWNNEEGDLSGNIRILLVLTVISLAPSILIMLTSFTRIIIVLHFVRTAIGTQTVPPNQVMVGLALFLTLFIMNPVISEINTEAYTPYKNNEITQEVALERAQVPLKRFMLRNTEPSSLNMYCDLAGIDNPADQEAAVDLPLRVVIPSFITTELKHAFEIGFYLYIPFLLIDIIVASTLMSMGMVMLPPSMISTPFKLLLFISINGWEIIFSTLVQTFQ